MGILGYILSDQEPQFVSFVLCELCNQCDTETNHCISSTNYNMTERVNHTLKCMWKSYVEDNHGKWDQYLPELRFAIN